MKREKILIAAGGSGGHLYPAQQLAHLLSQSADVMIAGHALSGSAFFASNRFSFRDIPAAPWGRSIKKLFRFFYTSLRSFYASFRLIREFQPDQIIGFGSYHVFPLLFAASVMRKRISLFEANCQLGRINRLFAPLAKEIYSQFSLKERGRMVPLLPWLENESLDLHQKEARRSLGLDENSPTVLVFGGSQGAQFFNETLPGALRAPWQVIHLTGKNNEASAIKQKYLEAGVVAFIRPFEENMQRLYRAADCAICRAGASTLAELIRFALPAILVPYPFAMEDHQTANAAFFADRIGGGLLLAQKEASQKSLQNALKDLSIQLEKHRAALLKYKKECEQREAFSKQILRAGEDL